MRTLVPAQTFLRVEDKFTPKFALEDQELCGGATLLYVNLFKLAEKDGYCWPSQATLTRACKCTSLRTVQSYLQQLVNLDYIQIEREGTHNVYRLLLSARVQRMIQLAGTDMISASPSAPTFPHPCTEPEASSAVIDPSLQCAKSASSTAQNVPVKGAKSAHDLRVYKNTKYSPLSPLSAPNPAPHPVRHHAGGVSLPAVPAKIEKGKPACVARDAKTEFEALFEAWPRRQDKFQAARAYASLARSGQLPPLQTLLDVVARFKAEDRSWRNGYTPNLRFWLLGKRWLDEITPATNGGTSSANAPSCAPAPLSPDITAHAQKLFAVRERHGPAVLSDAKEETPLTRAADELCRIWPHEDRGKIMSCLVLANIRGVSPDLVMSKAHEEQTLVLPVESWFRQVAA